MSQAQLIQLENGGVADTAILFSGAAGAELGLGLGLGLASELLPLIDRPMLQRVVEWLVRGGCQQLHVVLGDEPLPVKALLGDGSRWGCRVTYHHGSATEHPARLFRRLQLAPERHYVLANGWSLPADNGEFLQGEIPPGAIGRAAVHAQGESICWSGWGLFAGAWLLGDENSNGQSLESCVMQEHRITRLHMAQPWSAATPAQLLQSSQRLLQQHGAGIERQHSSQIHPSATIHPPAYIGRHVRVGANAVIGPHAVLCEGAFVDRDALVQNAVVLPHTYIGEGLDLRNSVARGARLANTALETVVEIRDPDLLSALPLGAEPASPPAWQERLLALTLRLVLAPLQLLTYPTARRAQATGLRPRRSRVIQPGHTGPTEVEVNMASPAWLDSTTEPFNRTLHFHDTFYPGLREVVRGRLRLAGPAPRSAAAVGALAEEWQALYLKARCGVLSEIVTQSIPDFSPEMQLASDAMACATQRHLRQAFGLLWRYLILTLRDFRAVPKTPSVDSSHAPGVHRGKSSTVHHRSAQ